MSDSYELMLNLEIDIELFESLIVKLSPIISDEDMRESKLVDDRLLEKIGR